MKYFAWIFTITAALTALGAVALHFLLFDCLILKQELKRKETQL